MEIKLGIDRLKETAWLKNKRIGLITNPTGMSSDYQSTVDIFNQGYKLTKLFSPEHGLYGRVQDALAVNSSVDPYTHLPVYSLYGKTRRPTQAMLHDIDCLVFDIQDVGVRFYTYIYTMALAMEACAEHEVQFVVLDRPNPLGGLVVEGTLLKPRFKSFVGQYALPVRHGLTIGELALWINAQFDKPCHLEIIKMQNWSRKCYFDQTGLPFLSPSPNMPTFQTVLAYPATCYLEGTNVSEGRGTTRPFEYIGAPWINSHQLAQKMNDLHLPGVMFRPISFVPTFSKYQGKVCYGIHLMPVNRAIYRPFDIGMQLLKAIQQLDGTQFCWTDSLEIPGKPFIDYLLGGNEIRLQTQTFEAFIARAYTESAQFARKTVAYHLYN